jgi:adenosylcobinamide-GDP ribazoletransferase
MSTQWRLFLLALRTLTRAPLGAEGASAAAQARDANLCAAARYVPLVGMLVGALGAVAYWLAAQIWPASVAVIASMLATVLLTGGVHERGLDALGMLFAVLIKYNALMALSASNLAFPLPEHVALGVIMIAGHAASRALAVSVIGTHPQATVRVSSGGLALALGLGFAPALIMGVPGLTGLAAALLARIAITAYAKRRLTARATDTSRWIDPLDATQQLAEICFYLGALAMRSYT